MAGAVLCGFEWVTLDGDICITLGLLGEQRGRAWTCAAGKAELQSGGAGRDANGEGMAGSGLAACSREDVVRCRAGGHLAKVPGVESSGL